VCCAAAPGSLIWTARARTTVTAAVRATVAATSVFGWWFVLPSETLAAGPLGTESPVRRSLNRAKQRSKAAKQIGLYRFI